MPLSILEQIAQLRAENAALLKARAQEQAWVNGKAAREAAQAKANAELHEAAKAFNRNHAAEALKQELDMAKRWGWR